ncbi:hypothetical protein AK972_2965 [Pseudomonas yamanorum]|nr:hypothetical protein AK972_2965 [Pseudomonas yamanorum]
MLELSRKPNLHKWTIGTGSMWERACSRKRWFSQPIHRLAHRLRAQARSHISNCGV